MRPSHTSSTSWITRLFAAGVLAVTASIGGCVESASAVGGVSEREDCSGGACATSTPDCSPAEIAARENATCAVCRPPSGAVEICGSAVVARCEAREDSFGQPCRFCATETGEVLFDSCYSGPASEELVCETTTSGAAGVGAPAESGDPLDDEGSLDCQTCNDAFGNVVRSACEPVADECHREEDGDRTCRICTRDGRVVVRECEQPAIAPRSCEVYGDDEGRCVDCYDDNDQLLSHFCTLTDGTGQACARSITPEGIECVTCTDVRGVVVSEQCGLAREVKRCELLVYTGQTCEVCVDETGTIVSQICEGNDCGEPGVDGCAPPPPCTLETAADGSICRTCPVEGTNEVEQRCLVGSALECGRVAGDGTSVAECVVCKDGTTGQEVYRRCDGTTSLPTCAPYDGSEGQLCEVCADPVTGQAIYSRCDAQACHALGLFELQSQEGGSLVVENTPAVASCSTCDGPTASTTCTLRSDCGGAALDGEGAACSGAVSFRLAPGLCANPWQPEATLTSPPQSPATELLDVMSWALETAGLGVISAESAFLGAPLCADSCGCVRGDAIELRVRVEDAATTVLLFDGVLERCATDDDCAGGVCRPDGGCAL